MNTKEQQHENREFAANFGEYSATAKCRLDSNGFYHMDVVWDPSVPKTKPDGYQAWVESLAEVIFA